MFWRGKSPFTRREVIIVPISTWSMDSNDITFDSALALMDGILLTGLESAWRFDNTSVTFDSTTDTFDGSTS